MSNEQTKPARKYPRMTPKMAEQMLTLVERKLARNPQDRTPQMEARMNYLRRKANAE